MQEIKAKIELLEVYGHKINDEFIISVCQNILNDLQIEKIEAQKDSYEKEILKKFAGKHHKFVNKKFPGFKGIDPDIWIEVKYIQGDTGKGIAKKAILLNKHSGILLKTNIRFDYMITRLKSFGIELKKIKTSYYELLWKNRGHFSPLFHNKSYEI